MLSTTLRRYLRSTAPPTPTVWGLTPALWLGFECLIIAWGIGDTLTTWLAYRLTTGGYDVDPIVNFALPHGLWLLVCLKLLVLLGVYIVTRLVLLDGTHSGRLAVTFAIYGASALFLVVSYSNFMAAYWGTDLFHHFFP